MFTADVGHGTADNLMDHFTKSVLESGLQSKNIIQISMDGSSVNWKFYGELKKKVNTETTEDGRVHRPKNKSYEVTY